MSIKKLSPQEIHLMRLIVKDKGKYIDGFTKVSAGLLIVLADTVREEFIEIKKIENSVYVKLTETGQSVYDHFPYFGL